MADEQEQKIPESKIVIQFAAPGATLMDVQFVGIFPGQMILAGDYLITKGRKFMEQLEQQQEQNRLIQPPKGKIVIPK